MHLAKAIEKPGCRNLTKIDLSDNKFTSKAGVYIGEALIKNPSYPLYNLSFENVYLGNDGLVRVIEAVNAN
jgi:Ran GTPase-activating protein (RanGAP) involved in mRNA processing and transport